MKRTDSAPVEAIGSREDWRREQGRRVQQALREQLATHSNVL